MLRIFCGARKTARVAARAADGKEIAVDSKVDGDTLRVRFPNDPAGAKLEVSWSAE